MSDGLIGGLAEGLWSALVALVTTLLITALFGHIRERRARRRGVDVSACGLGVVMVRLRGIALDYPGFWRLGRLDVMKGRWRPRSRVGVPACLAGARVWCVGPARDSDHLPGWARSETVLTCSDSAGRVFQLSAFDAADAYVTCGSVTTPARSFGLPDGISGVKGRAPCRWLRQRVPMPRLFVSVLVASLVWVGYWLVPLLSMSQVTATVVTNRGPEYLCEVRWTDPSSGTNGHGWALCGDRRPGEQMLVNAMGWPRIGTADDPGRAVTSALLVPPLVLLLPVALMGYFAYSRRRLAWTFGTLRRIADESTDGGPG